MAVRNICCVGAGYVGGPTSAVIAAKNPHINVTVVDLSEARISSWKSDDLPIYEPGLFELVQLARDATDGRAHPNLFFSTDIDAAVRAADIVFVAVNTPTKTAGAGAGRGSELAYFEAAVRRVAAIAEKDTIIVEKSTVPVRTAESVREIIDGIAHPDIRIDILSNPEFLAEGTAIRDLLKPDRILIGAQVGSESGIVAARALADVYAGWVPRQKIVTINLASSELAKLAANAMLAQRISTINALSAVCEAVGADIEHVAHACGLDSRIGSKMLKPSVGFGGSCFKKDVLSLAYIASTLHLPEVAAYFGSIVDINEYQKDRFTRRIVRSLYDSLSGKKIAILGFAYKKDTGDTRESAAISIIHSLVMEGADISVYDPQVRPEQITADMRAVASDAETAGLLARRVKVVPSALEACHDSYAVIILTEWDEFSNRTSFVNGPVSSGEPVPTSAFGRLDWSIVAQTMYHPMFVFDGRNVVDSEKLHRLGFRVEAIGKASMSSILLRSRMMRMDSEIHSHTPTRIPLSTNPSSVSLSTRVARTQTRSIPNVKPDRPINRAGTSCSNPSTTPSTTGLSSSPGSVADSASSPSTPESGSPTPWRSKRMVSKDGVSDNPPPNPEVEEESFNQAEVSPAILQL